MPDSGIGASQPSDDFSTPAEHAGGAPSPSRRRPRLPARRRARLLPRPMPGGLHAVAAGRHLAPAAAARSRAVVEDPAAAIVAADAEALGAAFVELRGDPARQLRQGSVQGWAVAPSLQAQARRAWHQLGRLAQPQRRVDGADRGGIGHSLLVHRVDQLAQAGPDGAQVPERAIGGGGRGEATLLADGVLSVEQPMVHEPVQGVVEGCEVIERAAVREPGRGV